MIELLRTTLSMSLQLAIVMPIIALAVDRESKWVKLVCFFAGFVVLQHVLLTLPIHFPQFALFEGRNNWTGKIFATFACVAIVLIFRRDFEHGFFIRLRQKTQSWKWTIPVCLVILVLDDGIPALFLSGKEWSTESLVYQLTMPGIQEELAYRGIMLGLLVTLCKKKLLIGKLQLGSPASLIAATLFGLAHSFSITAEWNIQFAFSDFYVPFVWGWLWAWMTLKSGSILAALVTHNLSNSLLNLYLMLKTNV